MRGGHGRRGWPEQPHGREARPGRPRRGTPESVDARRDAIVRAALALLDEGGFDQLSLRGLARVLGMHAPGLYWYIESKQDLLDLMAKEILDQGLADVKPLAEGQTWSDWLVDLACVARRALLSRRDGARVVASAFLLRTGAITPIIELSLEILEGAGFERLTALGATMTLMRFATGVALDEQASPIPPRDDPAMARFLAERKQLLIDAARYPRTADALSNVFAGKFHDRDAIFRWGAQMIVRGMADLRARR